MSNPHTLLLIDDHFSSKLKDANLPIVENKYTKGELILRKGQVSEHLHIIKSGQVNIYILQEQKVNLATLSAGQFFGEMSCLTSDPVSAHVEADNDVTTITLSKQGMMLLMDENPEFRMKIIETMVKRIQNSNTRVVEEHTKSVHILQENEQLAHQKYGEIIGNSPEIQQLLHQIEKISKTQSHVIIIGEPGTEKLLVARKIHEQTREGFAPFFVLQAEEIDLQSWTSKITSGKEGTIAIEHSEQISVDQLNELIRLSQNTRIIFIADDELSLPPLPIITIAPLRERIEDIPVLAAYFVEKAGAINGEALFSDDAIRLLKLYPYVTKNVEELQTVIQEAYILSEGRKIYSNHIRFTRHRKPGERPKIGLALGSGSARGIAHLGVLQVLEDENIPIDIIAGTSVGSLMGGAYAAQVPLKDLVKISSAMKWGNLVRPTIPYKSFVHNAPMIKFLEEHMGKQLIENLPIPFAAVASDLSTGEAHIMREGSLAHAIGASTAIPSIMRPVQFQGKTLVDGAVVHPVPAALVKSMGADIVIAVNVCAESFAKGTSRHFIDSLLNTIDIMSAKLVKEELQIADVVLRPDLGFNQITFKDYLFSIEAGKKVTNSALEQINARIEEALTLRL